MNLSNKAHVTVAVLTVVLASCSPDCAVAPCASGLTVLIPSGVTLPFTVTVSSNSHGTLTLTCANSDCASAVSFSNYTPLRVRTSIQWQGGALDQEFTPIYRTSAASEDSGCQATCRQATISFQAAAQRL